VRDLKPRSRARDRPPTPVLGTPRQPAARSSRLTTASLREVGPCGGSVSRPSRSLGRRSASEVSAAADARTARPVPGSRPEARSGSTTATATTTQYRAGRRSRPGLRDLLLPMQFILGQGLIFGHRGPASLPDHGTFSPHHGRLRPPTARSLKQLDADRVSCAATMLFTGERTCPSVDNERLRDVPTGMSPARLRRGSRTPSQTALQTGPASAPRPLPTCTAIPTCLA